jgi:hypothetical protein
VQRRGDKGPVWGGASLPADANRNLKAAYEKWVRQYGEDQAKYLLEEMSRWTAAYSHGTLIDFEFVRPLGLREQVQQICAEKGWQYDELPGDLRLFEMLLTGDWPETDFLIVAPGQKIVPTFNEQIIGVESPK